MSKINKISRIKRNGFQTSAATFIAVGDRMFLKMKDFDFA